MKKVHRITNVISRERNPQAGRVYLPHGISPSLDTCGGGYAHAVNIDSHEQENTPPNP